MIKEFTVQIDLKVLEDLKDRIRKTRWPGEMNNAGWTYGANLAYMKELADYWVNKFDWRKTEDEINKYPNFITHINGLKIHFLHIKGKGKKSMPLIITHGWPGSFLEMMKLIPLLTTDPIFSFDLVIPSIPGFGFSGKPVKPGCNSAFVADCWKQLMNELGYEKFAVQGGDIGAGISSWLSLKCPDAVKGLHLNYIPGSYRPYVKEGEIILPEVIEFQKLAAAWTAKEGAYAAIHSTKNQTLSYGLNDSPIGLCAWIIEKFHSWSDNSGAIENSFTKDELLANVTLYWVTETIHSSMQMYNENSRMPLAFGINDFIKVPVAFTKFPKELPTPPRSWIEKGFNIQCWTEMPAGGHFAAAEQPGLLADSLINFFEKL